MISVNAFNYSYYLISGNKPCHNEVVLSLFMGKKISNLNTYISNTYKVTRINNYKSIFEGPSGRIDRLCGCKGTLTINIQ